jgi:hypothetical protein
MEFGSLSEDCSKIVHVLDSSVTAGKDFVRSSQWPGMQ